MALDLGHNRLVCMQYFRTLIGLEGQIGLKTLQNRNVAKLVPLKIAG